METGWFSEEQQDKHCQAGFAMQGLCCDGSNCDNLNMKCSEVASHDLVGGYWTEFFSEEQGSRGCGANQVVTGMQCRGDYCDDIRLYCKTLQIRCDAIQGCNPGFTHGPQYMDKGCPKKDCTNVDECANNSLNNCDADGGMCMDSIGSYSCSCKDGYYGDGVTCTQCPEKETCEPGHRHGPIYMKHEVCGYQDCINIDECAEDSDNCSADAMCKDTTGDFECTCKEGFYGDGVQCDKCPEIVGCEDGFKLGEVFKKYEVCDYQNCENIDECLNADLNNCSADATCNDIDGSFECTCNEGFHGDGVDCMKCDEPAQCKKGYSLGDVQTLENGCAMQYCEANVCSDEDDTKLADWFVSEAEDECIDSLDALTDELDEETCRCLMLATPKEINAEIGVDLEMCGYNGETTLSEDHFECRARASDYFKFYKMRERECPPGSEISSIDECQEAIESLMEVRWLKKDEYGPELVSRNSFPQGCSALVNKNGVGRGFFNDAVEASTRGKAHPICKKPADDVDTSCKVGTGRMCKKCLDETMRTGADQCMECNEGYGLTSKYTCMKGMITDKVGVCEEGTHVESAEECADLLQAMGVSAQKVTKMKNRSWIKEIDSKHKPKACSFSGNCNPSKDVGCTVGKFNHDETGNGNAKLMSVCDLSEDGEETLDMLH